MASKEENPLASVLRKIPIFEGLDATQVRRILGLCRSVRCEADDIVCRAETPSDEMYILIEGQLAVVSAEGTRLALLSPVTTVGEMGALTGQKRVASVVATRPGQVLVVDRHQFDLVLREDSAMQVRVYRNFVNILAEKLKNDNQRMNDYERRKMLGRKRVETLEEALKRAEDRVEAGMAHAEEEGGLDRGEVRLHLADRVNDLVPRLLVVDDDDGFRRLVREALVGYEVLEAGNGHEALAVLQDERVDLVLTDIAMPDMDGYELFDKMRAFYPNVGVVAFSGYVHSEKVEGYGFDGFLGKPLSVVDLQVMVEEKLSVDEV